jgi:hypothetical protein
MFIVGICFLNLFICLFIYLFICCFCSCGDHSSTEESRAGGCGDTGETVQTSTENIHTGVSCWFAVDYYEHIVLMRSRWIGVIVIETFPLWNFHLLPQTPSLNLSTPPHPHTHCHSLIEGHCEV